MAKRETALRAYKRLVREFGAANVSILHGYEQMEPSELREWPRKYVDHVTEYDSALLDGRPNAQCILSVTW